MVLQSSNLAEQLKFVQNGIGIEQDFPSFLTSKHLEQAVNGNDNRLRIFSGTANPPLAQVTWLSLIKQRDSGICLGWNDEVMGMIIMCSL